MTRRLAALALLTALVVLWPRSSVASVPFRWTPVPSAGLHFIPTVATGLANESDAVQRGAPQPGERAFIGQTPAGAPQPAGRTSTGERLNPMPAPIVGWATWYDAGPGEYAAAGPRLRHDGWRGSWVVVTGFVDGRANSVTVALTDWCQCWKGTDDERLIDLSPALFLEVCGPLARGKCKAEVQW